MTQQGAILQGCNNELVKYMEDLCMQKKEIDQQIGKLIEDKTKIQNEIEMLTKQLESICESLLWKNTIQKKLDNILAEGIFAYDKILDSSRMLLSVLKKEIENLDKLIALKKLFSESP